jgi:hypothetical protein
VTPLVARVPTLGEVPRVAAVAVRSAAPQHRIERLQRLSVEPSDLKLTEHRPHVRIELAHVPAASGRLELGDFEEPVE